MVSPPLPAEAKPEALKYEIVFPEVSPSQVAHQSEIVDDVTFLIPTLPTYLKYVTYYSISRLNELDSRLRGNDTGEDASLPGLSCPRKRASRLDSVEQGINVSPY